MLGVDYLSIGRRGKNAFAMIDKKIQENIRRNKKEIKSKHPVKHKNS